MTTLKAPRIPLSATSPKLPFSKPLVLPSNESNQLSYYGKSQAADLIFDNEADSGAPSSKGDSGKSPTQSPIFKDNYVDPRLATFDRNVETMRNNLKAGIAEAKANAGTNTKVASVFLKPTEQKRIKDLLLFADGGEEGAASGDYRYNPKTDKIESLAKSESTTSTTQAEYSEETEIMASMSDDFSFDGWDSKSARQQQQELQRAGLSPQDQLTLLNSSTSLETLALIAIISKNRSEYGLSAQDVKDISTELLQISNARTGAKNHDIPFLTSPITTKIFLKTLDEKEEALIGPFMSKNPVGEGSYPGSNTKKDNRTPLMKGKYIGYTTVDMTEDLYKFMRESAYLLKNLKATAKSDMAFMGEFIHFVKTNGALDIKSQKPWMFIDGLTYKFNGEVMRNDDLGNIAFGYYGAAVYGKDFLHFGAGLYQLISDIQKLNPIQINGKFYDDPQDYDMIAYGYNLYKEDHPD